MVSVGYLLAIIRLVRILFSSHASPRNPNPILLLCASSCANSRSRFMTATKRTVKVAIIGSGLAGLTAAFLLSSASDESRDVEFEVHVFDKVCNPEPYILVLIVILHK